jgi:hypothetical protein
MTARDTIATNVHAAWCREPNHEDCDGVDEADECAADAVIAAVGAMPVEDQAELIGGTAQHADNPTRNLRYRWVVGPDRSEPLL